MLEVPPFARRFFDADRRSNRIGEGELGGKAEGLLRAGRVLARGVRAGTGALSVDVPALVVLASGFFDAFVERNGLAALLEEAAPDERIAAAFHRAAIPAELVGDLRALAAEVKIPLAVRSSSVLEDALGQPFAGVYGTKMIPGDAPDVETRFRSLLDAVKFVWASTWFARARAYLEGTTHRGERERMAVLVQEVVGRRHGDRFYPDLAGVVRSLNFYPQGGARTGDGVLDLALGLGKTIVDGEACWTVSPARPQVGPPFGSVRELVQGTQSRFWAVRVGSPPPYDPMAETEFLVRADLAAAEADGTLDRLASTYDPRSERLWPGLGRAGPRVLDFAPLLGDDTLPLIACVRELLAGCEDELGAPVEIEFALDLPTRAPARFGFLQVRPLVLPTEVVAIDDATLADPAALVVSRAALGNGRFRLDDVVYVVPERFETRATAAIALELAQLNRGLLAAGRHCLLIGFGRWGSSDPWLGIPVRWDQISAARAIVEATLPQLAPQPSQGSHFFHNLASFGVLYLTLRPGREASVDWAALAALPAVAETAHARHVRYPRPLLVEVDGRSQRGVVRPATAA
jgi:hypothetical protein